MTSINGVTVIPRHNRPSTVQITDLRLYFYGDGVQRNPFEVCSVHIFKDTKAATNGDPSIYLDLSAGSPTYGEIAASAVSSADFIFSGPGNGRPGTSSFDISSFSDTDIAGSSIYRNTAGELAVFLRPGGLYLNYEGEEVSTGVSATGRYFDIWTIRDVTDSLLRTYIQTFELFRDNFYAITSPLQIRIASKLVNKYIEYGAREDLIFRNTLAIMNRDIDESVKNVLKKSIIQSASIQITKINDDQTLTPFYEVSGFSETSGLLTVTSNDDVVFNWDTTDLTAFNSINSFGPKTGLYQVQLKVEAAGQVFYSDKFRLIVR